MNRELLQQSLNVLKEWDALIKFQYTGSSEAMSAMQIVAWHTVDAISALEAELAKPEQEELIQFKDGKWSYVKKPWVGLTDDEGMAIAYWQLADNRPLKLVIEAIESKLKEKNT
jgi:vancomycin resistance protein YoaR